MEKTATTSLQQWLYSHPKLLANNNIIYPKNFTHINHWDLVVASQHFQSDEEFRQRGIHSEDEHEAYRSNIHSKLEESFTAAKETGSDILISTEHAHSRLTKKREVERFLMLFSEFFDNLIVFLTIRPQTDLALSLISTLLRGGIEVTPNYLNHVQPSNYYYNIESITNNWLEFLDEKQLKLNIYDPTSDQRVSILNILGKRIPSDFSPLGQLNTGLDLYDLKFINWLIKKGIFAEIKNMILNYPSPKTRNQLALNEEEIRQLNDRFRDGNTATLKRFNLSQDLFLSSQKHLTRAWESCFQSLRLKKNFSRKCFLPSVIGNWIKLLSSTI